jgi:hypothetical protein
MVVAGGRKLCTWMALGRKWEGADSVSLSFHWLPERTAWY